jgi:hypothetical protein
MWQSYQEVSRIILEELVNNPREFQGLEHHQYFFDLKNKYPEKYKRLFFNVNGSIPYSKDLSDIFMDFKVCGFMDYKNNIIQERVKDYLAEKNNNPY